MATINIVRSGKCLLPVLNQKWLQFVRQSPLGSSSMAPICEIVHRKSTNVDALDIFTTNILSKKIPAAISTPDPQTTGKDHSELQKKEVLRTKQNADLKLSATNIEDWTQAEIDRSLIVSMDCSDRKSVDQIIQRILTTKQLPSETVILRVLCYLCDDTENSMTIISNLIDVCQEKNLAFYAKSIEFAPFLSQYLWKLKRFDDALHTLNEIWINKRAKSLILRNYRQIIYDAVKNHDEIVRDKVITNAIKINEKFRDPILITYVWSDCFFSELFRNNQKANDLFTTHDVIRLTVSKDIGWIASTLLHQHNVDAIHRLIEQCLAAKMTEEVGVCLVALFDYHCKS